MKKILAIFAFALVAFMAHAQSCPDDNHPHAIDLGLPSGTKWACCNVGANKPEEYGAYYAWGETEDKEGYYDLNYIFCTGKDTDGNGYYDQNIHFQQLDQDIAGTQYDVAHVKWGGDWQIPSIDQIEELIFHVYRKWDFMNDCVFGMKLCSNNDTIFFPATGFRSDTNLYYAGNTISFWLSIMNMSNFRTASSVYFSNSINWYVGYYPRSRGCPVRPVIRITNNINLPKSPSDISNQSIYNLYGIKVADKAADMNTLPPGIYIVNGKKFVVK